MSLTDYGAGGSAWINTNAYTLSGNTNTITLYPNTYQINQIEYLPAPAPIPDDPISWLKRRVQETIDAVDWPKAA